MTGLPGKERRQLAIHQTLAEWSHWFWPMFANHLWQATLFALVVWIAVVWLSQARARHTAWLMAFTKFLLPSAPLVLLAQKLGLNLSWPARTEMTAGADAVVLLQIAEPVAQANAGESHNEVYCVLTILWLTGVALCLARWRRRRRRLAAAMLAGEKIETGREAETLENLKSRLNIRRSVNLIVSSRFAEPVAWGALRPVIVLPRGLSERLGESEMESVLMHEMFHIKHYDNLFGSLQMFVCSLLWFHPLVWLIDRRLIEERELRCDERVVLSGATPEAYAASLWKVVQFGFGWPVEGVSRATGSNLKRRVKLMLNASHLSKSSTASRALAGLTFIALIVLAAVMALFSRDGAAVVKAQNDGGQMYFATAPMRFENLPEIPLVITEARLSVSEAREKTAGGISRSGKIIKWMSPGGKAHDAEFVIALANQGARRITDFLIEIQNAPLWDTRHFSIISGQIAALEKSADAQVSIDPQGYHTFKLKLSLDEKMDDRELMTYLYEFKTRVTGVKFDSEELWLMALPGKTPSTAKVRMMMRHVRDEPKRDMERDDSVGGQNQNLATPIHQMNSSMRPTILYREKAQYTQEARDNRVEGFVVLRVVFGVDGQISGVRVIRGLPHGLTQNAIEAAKKIRFEPAMKNGQPVSVSGTLEYNFRL